MREIGKVKKYSKKDFDEGKQTALDTINRMEFGDVVLVLISKKNNSYDHVAAPFNLRENLLMLELWKAKALLEITLPSIINRPTWSSEEEKNHLQKGVS